MATASTNTVIDHTTDAGYRTWIAELITQFLAVGLTQTSDTGQVNTATVTRPAINTLNAYAVFRFNDTEHTTNPIFFKLDFGTGTATDRPQIRITVGRGSNGSGTINGLTMTRVGCNAQNVSPVSTVNPYTSRFCYNPTQGFFGFIWKYGALSATTSHGGFFIYRSVDATGEATSDSTHLIANGSTDAGGVSSNAGSIQVISHINNAVYNTSPFPSGAWVNGPPLNITTSFTYAGDTQTIPIWQYTPVLGFTNALALALTAEIPHHTTLSMTVMGAGIYSTHTYMSVGPLPGSSSSYGSQFTNSVWTMLMLWE